MNISQRIFRGNSKSIFRNALSKYIWTALSIFFQNVCKWKLFGCFPSQRILFMLQVNVPLYYCKLSTLKFILLFQFHTSSKHVNISVDKCGSTYLEQFFRNIYNKKRWFTWAKKLFINVKCTHLYEQQQQLKKHTKPIIE